MTGLQRCDVCGCIERCSGSGLANLPEGWAIRMGRPSCSAECFATLYGPESFDEDDPDFIASLDDAEPPGAGEDVFERAMRARFPERKDGV